MNFLCKSSRRFRFGSWLKRIVVNRSINVLRIRKLELMPENEEFDVKEEEAVEAIPA